MASANRVELIEKLTSGKRILDDEVIKVPKNLESKMDTFRFDANKYNEKYVRDKLTEYDESKNFQQMFTDSCAHFDKILEGDLEGEKVLTFLQIISDQNLPMQPIIVNKLYRQPLITQKKKERIRIKRFYK